MDVAPPCSFGEDAVVVVGIPAYNEEVGIGSTVLGCRPYADRTIVVDDGSTDRTSALARDAGAEVVEHDRNRGKGAAVSTLLNRVREADHEVDVLVLLDGDGQHKPWDIPTVAGPVLEGDSDVVIGSRYLGEGDPAAPAHRRLGGRVLDALTPGYPDTPLTDTQSGFRAMSADAVRQLNLRTDGMGVESEMVSTADERDLDIREVPIDVQYEGIDGQTYGPLRHGLAVLAAIVRLLADRYLLVWLGTAWLVASMRVALPG